MQINHLRGRFEVRGAMNKIGLGIIAVGLLAGTPVLAADMALKAPPPPPVWNWSGCYLGGDVGYGWQRDKDNETVPATGAPTGFSPNATYPNGVIGGGYLGCNWQPSGPWVIGLEGDLEGANIANATGVYAPSADFYRSNTQFQASIRGRVGWAFGRGLLYGTGGAAFASIRDQYTGLEPNGFTTNITDSRVGWTAGVGWEYAFTGNWIGRIEYRHSDFGSATNGVTFCATCGAANETHATTEDAVRVGISYKFGGPVFLPH
jgi:outer membrane immunogenic protein